MRRLLLGTPVFFALAGACGAVPTSPAQRGAPFARTVFVDALDWAAPDPARPERTTDATDAVAFESDATVLYLAFRLPHATGRVVRATLRLQAAGPAPAAEPRGEWTVHSVAPFTGPRTTWRSRPALVGDPIAVLEGPSGGATRPAFDVTTAVARARAARLDAVAFGVRRPRLDPGTEPRRVASPAAIDPTRRPRLDVVLGDGP